MENRKDVKLFISLMFWALIPSIYQLIRMQIVTYTNVDINILGQLEWYNLLNEIIVTVLITPLYYLLKADKNRSEKDNGAALIVSSFIYFMFTAIVYMKTDKIAQFMYADHAVAYLRIETLSMAIEFVSTYLVLIYTINNRDSVIYKLLFIKTLLLVCVDFLVIPLFKENGVAYSGMCVNLIITIVSLHIAFKSNLIKFSLQFWHSWMKEWIKIGLFSGIQIFLDNYIYAVMVCKMVNQVGESGNYWISNNFIYGWLLVPVFQLGEIIKKNKLKRLNFRNTWRYIIGILLFWLITMPFWSGFIKYGMGIQENSIIGITNKIMPFYIVFILSYMIDAWFLSIGKTYLLMVNSIIVNVLYYGCVYILFLNDIFRINLDFIIYMFGVGIIVHFIVSIVQLTIIQFKKL